MQKLDKNLFVRVDSGTKIGIGHVMRCFALVENLKKRFDNILFISNQIPGNLSSFIKNRGYKVYHIQGYTHIEEKKLNPKNIKKRIESDAKQCIKIIENYPNAENWVLVDHYGIDHKWENKIYEHVKKIIVIDDLANRKHNCDVLIDQNFYKNMKNRYKKLLPPNCTQLIGPKYILLRQEFKIARNKVKIREKLKRILVSFGGSDITNETYKSLLALKSLNLKCKIDVVVGSANPNINSIKEICDCMGSTNLYHNTNKIAKLMVSADLSIGGGGSMTWERCCLGLPAIVSILSKNQHQLIKNVSKVGCVINLGQSNNLSSEDYLNALLKIDSKLLKNMSKKCFALVDTNGIKRVTTKIFQIKCRD